RRTPYQIRFIEFMPLDADHAWTPDQVLTGAEIRDAIADVYPLEPEPREPSATARVYRFTDGAGSIGFINPVSEPFCGDCNRIRVTADGRLRTCLFSLNETDLRSPMREGAGDDDLRRIIRDAVWRKELKHHIGEAGFIQPTRTRPARGGWGGPRPPAGPAADHLRGKCALTLFVLDVLPAVSVPLNDTLILSPPLTCLSLPAADAGTVMPTVREPAAENRAV